MQLLSDALAGIGIAATVNGFLRADGCCYLRSTALGYLWLASVLTMNYKYYVDNKRKQKQALISSSNAPATCRQSATTW